jgi:hypothetical protein
MDGISMDSNLLKKVPKKYHAAITDLYHDEDGYWCVIGCNSGYKLESYYSEYTIHEDNLNQFLSIFEQIVKSN